MDAELFRIGVGGVVPVQWEAEKSDSGPGTLTGWASVYNVVDQQDDVVVPGAFKRTLDQWRASKRVIGLTLDHQNDADGVIGKLTDAQDTSYGLKTTFAFSSTAKAQDARTKAREGILNGLSFFGPIINKGFDTVAGKSVQLLKEVGLWFVGLTPMPANTGALVLAAKGGRDEDDDPLSDVWICDMKAALTITSKPARKAAVDLLVRTQYQLPEPVVEPDGGDTTADEKDGGLDEAAKYALSIIGESGPDESPPGGDPSNDSLAGLFASLDAEKTKSELDGLEAELKKVSES
jgi:HK97 family phage prohead protease